MSPARSSLIRSSFQRFNAPWKASSWTHGCAADHFVRRPPSTAATLASPTRPLKRDVAAVVARVAAARDAFLAEVVGDAGVPAFAHLRIGHHLRQARVRMVYQRRAVLEAGLFDEEGLQLAISRAVEERAFRRPPVASRAPSLLVVSLQAARQVVMDDPPDAGDVDSHAEGRGRDHDPCAPGREVILGAAPRISVLPAVVARDAELGPELLRRGHSADVDESLFPGRCQQADAR